MPRPGHSKEQKLQERAERVKKVVSELREELPKGKPFQKLCDTLEDIQKEIEELREYYKFRGIN